MEKTSPMILAILFSGSILQTSCSNKNIEKNIQKSSDDIPIYRSKSWEWDGGVDGMLMQTLSIGWESYGRSIRFEFIEGRERCETISFRGIASATSETTALYSHDGCNITFKLDTLNQIEAIDTGCDNAIGENCMGFGGLYKKLDNE